MDSTFVPVRSHHYDPELTFDFCVNEPAWSNQAGIHSAFGSTDRLYFRKEVPVNHDNDLSSSYSTTVWRGERANAQILVWSSEALEQVRVSTQDLRSAEGNIIPKDRITSSWCVTYCPIIRMPRKKPSAGNLPTNPAS